MTLRAFALSDIGCLRVENEDSSVCDDTLRLYGVADGIGGLPGGAQASLQALVAFRQWLTRQPAGAALDYAEGLRIANEAVHQLGRHLSPRYGIGTTLTLGHIAGDTLHLMHVGDSFLFLLRDGELHTLTVEHNVENEMKVRLARGEPIGLLMENRAALTRCVGQPPPLQGDISAHALQAGDRLLFCTDGITRCVMPDEIGEHLAEAAEPEHAARRLVDLANARGGLDNSTAVVLFVD